MSENSEKIQRPADSTPEDNGGQGGRMFTQEEVNRIVSDRLAREREKSVPQPPAGDGREEALKARETRMDCREYLERGKYRAELLDVLDCSDVERFKSTVEKLVKQFPDGFRVRPVPPPYAERTGAGSGSNDELAAAFKPPRF